MHIALFRANCSCSTLTLSFFAQIKANPRRLEAVVIERQVGRIKIPPTTTFPLPRFLENPRKNSRKKKENNMKQARKRDNSVRARAQLWWAFPMLPSALRGEGVEVLSLGNMHCLSHLHLPALYTGRNSAGVWCASRVVASERHTIKDAIFYAFSLRLSGLFGWLNAVFIWRVGGFFFSGGFFCLKEFFSRDLSLAWKGHFMICSV